METQQASGAVNPLTGQPLYKKKREPNMTLRVPGMTPPREEQIKILERLGESEVRYFIANPVDRHRDFDRHKRRYFQIHIVVFPPKINDEHQTNNQVQKQQ